MSWLLALVLIAGLQADELERALTERRWSVVEDLARERLSEDPDDTTAHSALGRALLARSRALAGGTGISRSLRRTAVDGAVEHLGRALEHEGLRELWLEARAEHPDADATLDAELRELADAGDAHAGWLWARRQPAAGGAALERLERAVASRPGNPAFASTLLEWRLVLADQPGAEAAWALAKDAGADVDHLASMSLQLWPGAEQAERRGERLDELAVERGLERDAWLGWYRAHALLQQGRVEEALVVFAAGERPAPASVKLAHAAALAAHGRPLDASALLLPLAADGDWEAYDQAVSVADSLALARRFPEALALYDALLEVERRDERAQRHRALTLWRGGRGLDAGAAFEELNRRWPDRADLLNDAGLAAWGSGDLTAAEARFRAAIELPQSVDARENLAALLIEARRPGRAEARSLLQEVLAEEPARARALVLLGRLSESA